MNRLIVVMGVSGSGKSTIGSALAAALAVPFLEGDDFHPKANVEKMASGRALTDEDRIAWLDAIAAHVERLEEIEAVLSCSALNPFVRGRLRTIQGWALQFVWLKLDEAAIRQRMKERDHFMPPSLLKSQFDALQPPGDAMEIDAGRSVPNIIEDVVARLGG